jgi:hypothetical protein
VVFSLGKNIGAELQKKRTLVQGFWAAQPHERRYFDGIFLNTRQKLAHSIDQEKELPN